MIEDQKNVAHLFLSCGNNLIDGHRHGNHFSQNIINLSEKPVESWDTLDEFRKYEQLLNTYTPQMVEDAILFWNNKYDKNLVKQVIDWSFKEYSDIVYKTYNNIGIDSLKTILWKNYTKDNKNCNIIILDDERYINKSCIESARNAILSGKYITVHCMQSPYFVRIGYSRFSSSLIKLLYKNNILCEKTILVHMNCASDDDIELTKKTKARVVICPGTAIYLKSPINHQLFETDFNIGTDGVTISNTGSLLQNALWLFEIGKKFFSEKIIYNKICRALTYSF